MTLWLLTARWCTVAGHLTILQLCRWYRQWYDYVHKVFCCCFCWSEPWAALCCAVAVELRGPQQHHRTSSSSGLWGAHTWTQTLQSRSRTSHLSLSTCHPSPSLRAVTVSRPRAVQLSLLPSLGTSSSVQLKLVTAVSSEEPRAGAKWTLSIVDRL